MGTYKKNGGSFSIFVLLFFCIVYRIVYHIVYRIAYMAVRRKGRTGTSPFTRDAPAAVG